MSLFVKRKSRLNKKRDDPGKIAGHKYDKTGDKHKILAESQTYPSMGQRPMDK